MCHMWMCVIVCPTLVRIMAILMVLLLLCGVSVYACRCFSGCLRVALCIAMVIFVSHCALVSVCVVCVWVFVSLSLCLCVHILMGRYALDAPRVTMALSIPTMESPEVSTT